MIVSISFILSTQQFSLDISSQKCLSFLSNRISYMLEFFITPPCLTDSPGWLQAAISHSDVSEMKMVLAVPICRFPGHQSSLAIGQERLEEEKYSNCQLFVAQELPFFCSYNLWKIKSICPTFHFDFPLLQLWQVLQNVTLLLCRIRH